MHKEIIIFFFSSAQECYLFSKQISHMTILLKAPNT